MNKKRNLIWLVVIIIFAAYGILLIVYPQGQAISAELNNLKLIPMPERFTELYFENSSRLPKHTVAGQSLPFAFTIHNMEGATTTYPYNIYIQYPFAKQTTIASGTVTLADSASTTINESPMFAITNEQLTVVVELVSLNQQIDFHLPNDN